MAATRNRVSIKRKRAVKYGQKTVQVRIGLKRKPFTVHADLLCARSPFFREQIQKRRKAVEGDCSICHEELLPGVNEMTFCAWCGGNFHLDCIRDWNKRCETAGNEKTCPLCRRDWGSRPITLKRPMSYDFPTLDEVAFEIYVEWLYKGHISYQEDDITEHFDSVTEAYVLGIDAKDQSFCDATLRALLEMIKDTKSYPVPETIMLAYDEDRELTPEYLRLRQFFVQIYAVSAECSWFEEEDWPEYPHEFLRDLAIAMFKKHPANDDWEIEAMIEKLYAEEKDDGDNDGGEEGATDTNASKT